MIEHTTGALTLARRAHRALETYKELTWSETKPTDQQREIVASWPGWGPLAKAFEPVATLKGGWQELHGKVAELLNSEEERAARLAATGLETAGYHATEQTDTAFFTTPLVAESVWSLLVRLGFTGGHVLEPGCGGGAFIKAAPPGFDVDWTGVEIDPTSAGIAQMLHPGANIINRPLEKTPLRTGAFAAAIGNVPFSKYGPYDPTYPADEAGGNPQLHNYFIWKALEAVRPGGIVALVTSRYTLDAQMSGHREVFAGLATFLGAIRLPTGIFDELGNDVVVDIVVLRRNTGAEASTGPAWLQSQDRPELETRVNEYFTAHPDMVLGQMRPRGGARNGRTLDVVPPKGADVAALLSEAIDRLVASATEAGLVWEPGETAPEPMEIVACEDKESSYHLHEDGSATQVVDGEHQRVKAGPELKALILLRDAAVQLFDADADLNKTDAEVEPLRTHVRALYEGYVAKWGPLQRCNISEGKPDPETGLPTIVRRRPGLGGFRTDPDYPTVLALENYDDHTSEAFPAAILLRRVNRRPQRKTRTDSPQEAVALCIDQVGRFDLPTVAALLGISALEAPGRLGELAFYDPDERQWVEAAEYLSGDVRVKLASAILAAGSDPGRYQRNVDALRKVQPRDLGPAEIKAALGSPWIPARDVAAFVAQLFDLPAYQVTVKHEPYTASWEVMAPSARRLPSGTTTYGTSRVNAVDLIQQLLNVSAPAVYDTEKVRGPDGKVKEVRVRNEKQTQLAEERRNLIQSKFTAWLWNDPRRARRLAELYNAEYNATVLRAHNGRGFTFPGMTSEFDPYGHQLDMVARIVQTPGVSLCGYAVGAGKTAIMYMSAFKLKELGLASKPLIIVPNHLLEQMASDGRRLFPAARILMVTREDLTKERRKAFAAKVAAADWDAVVMTHEQFTSIPVSANIEAAYLADLIDQCYKAVSTPTLDNTRTSKRIAKMIRKLRARHAMLTDRNYVDNGLTFDQLGLDFVFVDECHFFKNLYAPTRMEGFSMPGSKRAEDLFLKLSWLRKARPGGRVAALFSGTLMSNTLAEAYTWMRYSMPERLEAKRILSFDAFGGMFITYETKIEVNPNGSGFRMHRRPSRFRNVPELRLLLNERADIRTRKHLNLAGPRKVTRIRTVVEPPPELGPYAGQLVDRTEDIRKGNPQILRSSRPGEDRTVTDNMLLVCGDGRAVSVDMRLRGITPTGPTLVDEVVANIARIYHETKDWLYPDTTGNALFSPRPGAFQLAFLDIGTPGAEPVYDYNGLPLLDRNKVYGLIRDGLIAAGVPREEIAFGHDAKNVADRKAQFAACCDGRIKVLLTSTAKGGTGVNIHPRLVAIHHIDVTWRPDEMEQRDGRGNRPGNLNDELFVYVYAVKGSFAPYMLQGLERKQRFIDQLCSGDTLAREVEDILSEETLGYAAMKAISTGMEKVMELEQAKADVARYRNLAADHTRGQKDLTYGLDRHARDAHTAEAEAQIYDHIAEAAYGRARTLKCYTHTWEGEQEVLAELVDAARDARAVKVNKTAGFWRGVRVAFGPAPERGKGEVRFYLSVGPSGEVNSVGPYELSPTALRDGQHWRLLQGIDKAIDSAAEQAVDARERAKYLHNQVARIREQIGLPFGYEAELRAAEKRQQDLEDEITEALENKKTAAHPRGGQTLLVAA